MISEIGQTAYFSSRAATRLMLVLDCKPASYPDHGNCMKTESTAGLNPYAAVAGLMLALDCKPAGAALHLYGFNWSRRHWKSHAIAAEERFIRTMVRLQLKPQPLHHPHHGVCAAVRQTQQTFSHRQGGERLWQTRQ